MNRLVRLIVFIIIAWSVYWFVAGYGLRSAIAGWFEQRQQQGWQAEFSDIGTTGYPARHVTRLGAPILADPANGTAWSADWIDLDSPAIWPGRQTLRFADTPQRLSYFDQTAIVAARNMQADLHLKPGVALMLERMALTSDPWSVARDGKLVAGARNLNLIMVQTETPETYAIVAEAQAFTPGEDLRDLMQSAASLPQEFETLQLDMTVRFDKPWDRSALEERRPQPVVIDLALAEAKWGALRLFATGELNVDAQGVPTGEIALKAENWRDMVAMANAAGVLPDQAIDPVNRVLNLLAGLGGNPNALDVLLNFRNGYMALGPIPLGPAPRLILR
ncbi:DUF2125 domain-containing protein [Ruegeria sediminis]|uniref:DUF2125 domain-containing protein n=1 Tax=Ruegeria sediminis TaxID=2583820 RepID=A0ABY2X4E2_9RHOB|nr:DUF2125 domain-containing protein [Ruegeria sediminis]TMV09914.1 DUF2125 domain-containing protein [Ruegeria sediminis]